MNSIRPSRIAALFLVLPLLTLASCGGNADSGESNAAGSAQDPQGPLTERSIGEVDVGANEEDVRDAFGEPDRTQEVNLSGPGTEAPQVNWEWNVPGGSVVLEFDNSTGTMAAYRVTSPEFVTNDGISVGDPFKPLKVRLGDQISKGFISGYVIGEDGPMSDVAIALQIKGGLISEIRGGSPFQPAGE